MLEMKGDSWSERVSIVQGSFSLYAVGRANERLKQASGLLRRGQSFMAKPLGGLLAETLVSEFPEVLIPLSKEESLEVGFSPSVFLALEVANYWGLPVNMNNDNLLNKRVGLIGDLSELDSIEALANNLFNMGVRAITVHMLLAPKVGESK